ncbi:MAG: PKD domain-containing protein, partial [Planctomycetota bacterium]
MIEVRDLRVLRTIPLLMVVLIASNIVKAQHQDSRPIADAGWPRYAAQDPVVLDGRGSYDPDNLASLSYRFTWRQIAGPTVIISDADTAIPTISGFTQTDEIQECEFELIVSNGEYDSLSDTVRVVVVPYFGESNLRLENKSFDPNKPLIIYFGGGDGTIGHTGQYISDPDVLSRANVIDFPQGY